MLRIDGNLQPLGEVVLTPEDTRRFIETLLDEKQQFVFNEVGQVDSYSVSGMGRFRVNAYRQRGVVLPPSTYTDHHTLLEAIESSRSSI